MATYTAEQLRLGTPIEALTAGTTYDFIVSRAVAQMDLLI